MYYISIQVYLKIRRHEWKIRKCYVVPNLIFTTYSFSKDGCEFERQCD